MKPTITISLSFSASPPSLRLFRKSPIVSFDHVKPETHVSAQDLKSLRALAEEKKVQRYLCVCLEPRMRTVHEVTGLPYRKILDELWRGTYS